VHVKCREAVWRCGNQVKVSRLGGGNDERTQYSGGQSLHAAMLVRIKGEVGPG
jgi:hypothetical protein